MLINARRIRPELMDDPAIDADAHRRALDGLARLNALSGCTGLLWSKIAPLTQGAADPLRVLDVASGAGDIPIRLALRAGRSGRRLQITACDLSPVAIGFASRRAARAGVRMNFFQADVLRSQIPGEYDVVLSSLFLHHLQKAEAIDLLGKMQRAAGRMVLVSDLNRSAVNYSIVRAASYVLTRSPVVRHDGPASVLAAFTAHEALRLAEEAGLRGATVTRHPPCRFLLTWERT